MTNFIFVVADDLGYADLGCYGGRSNCSPHLDHLAANGVRYVNGYANAPVCSPTRFALMTGRYQYWVRGASEEPMAGNARGNPELGLFPSLPTLPSMDEGIGWVVDALRDTGQLDETFIVFTSDNGGERFSDCCL